MMGRFTGLRSPLIDLTGDEPSILEPAEEPRILEPAEAPRPRIKKEHRSSKPPDQGLIGSARQESVEHSAVKSLNVSDSRSRSTGVKKRKSVIPLELKKSKKRVLRVASTDEEGDESAALSAVTGGGVEWRPGDIQRLKR